MVCSSLLLIRYQTEPESPPTQLENGSVLSRVASSVVPLMLAGRRLMTVASARLSLSGGAASATATGSDTATASSPMTPAFKRMVETT